MGMSENRWQKENFVVRLKSPLHIGYIGYIPFKGPVVSPTRYYVPGRNFWGAVTKRITEHLCKVPEADDYKKIGKQVMENFRFSYFYLYDGKTIYLPHYTDKGMKYGDNKKKITKAEFEHRFIGSIVSTGIDDKTKTAKDKSLHEIEFINNRFRDENGDIKAVKIAGCIWIKKDAKINDKDFKIDNGIFIDDFNIISELILGGESKYGFGHVLLDLIDKVNFPLEYIMKSENHDEQCKGEVKIKCGKNKPLIAHLRYDREINFEGEVELLTGRGYYDPNKLKNSKNEKQKFCMDSPSSEGKNNSTDDMNPGKVISRPVYYFSPGTVLKKIKEKTDEKLKKKTDEKQEEQEESIICKLNWDGTLEECYNANAPH